MVNSNGGAPAEVDVWEAFDEAVDRAETGLERARDNFDSIRQTDVALPDIYATAIAEIASSIQEFDSVYNVTDEQFERADAVANRAAFVADVTDAYREYQETVIARRVAIARDWFDALDRSFGNADADIAVDQSTLARQMQALRKLADAGKYGQLQSSDRFDLDAIESDVRRFDTEVREAVSEVEYVQRGLELAHSFHEQYTEDLAALNRAGVDSEAISVTELVQDVPATEPIATRLEHDALTDADADDIGKAVTTYAVVTRRTGRDRARYELGRALLAAVEEIPPVTDSELVGNLRHRLTSLQVEPIEERIATILRGTVTTSEAQRLLGVLSEHDGSVRETAATLDRSTDEVFEQLQELFVQGRIADLEVRFE